MISFGLKCDGDHEFEGWFRTSADFEDQKATGHLSCPTCGSAKIDKALMAPNVATKGVVQSKAVSDSDTTAARSYAYEMAKKVREHVEDNFDYVGPEFAKEVRQMHDGDTEERGVYGEATGHEVKELLEDGIDVAPVPDVPTKNSKKKIN